MRIRLVLIAMVSILALLVLVVVNATQLWERQENLRNDVSTGTLGGEASLPLFVGAQAERRLSAAYLARPDAAARRALEQQRRRTDEGVRSFRHLSGSELEVGQRHEWRYVERIYDELGELDHVRRRIDDRSFDQDQAITYYTGVVTKLIEFYQALSAMDDPRLTVETRALVGLFWASDGLAMEDTLISAARAAGRMTADHRQRFAEAYGTQRVMYDRWISPYLPARDAAAYQRITTSDAWRTTSRVERAVINAPTDSARGHVEDLPPEVAQWDAAHAQVAADVAALNLSRTQGLLAHGLERADELRTQVLWQVGGSLAAVVLIAVLIIGIARKVIRRTDRLEQAATRVAEVQLPEVVEQLQHGRPVDTGRLPALSGERDEIGRVWDAFARVVTVSVSGHEQLARERAGFGAFSAGMAARTGNLVGRILDRIDDLQDTYGDTPELLDELMAVDALVVGVRRQTENVVLLAGGEIPDPYQEPMRLADVLNTAASEVEDFERIDQHTLSEVSLDARVVSWVIHLLAELLDNATRFSASRVTMTAEAINNRLVIEVEDRGPGVDPELYEQMNARLRTALPYADLARDAHRLGLFTVGHLAEQLGAEVTLRRGPLGGTSAVLLVPGEYVVRTGEPPAGPVRRPVPVEPALARRPARPEPEPRPTPEPAPPLARRPARFEPVRPAPARDIPVRTAPAGDVPVPLPERRPGTHLAPQLLHPRATALRDDGATPEEVADAYAEYERATTAAEAEAAVPPPHRVGQEQPR